MNLLRTARYRLRALFRKARLDRETEDEMRFHVEMLAKEYEADGMSASEAARRARMEFGGLEKMKEATREARGIMGIENIIRDARLALRQMARSPGFTLVALATLGIGIGACGAMFSVVRTVLLKPLPFEEPERLVWISNYQVEGLSGQTTRVDNFLTWREQNESFESMGGYFAFFDYHSCMVADDSGGGAERVRAVPITEGFLETLGVKPMLGRGFEPDEMIWDAPPVVILSYDYWQRRFEGDAGIVGRSARINGEPAEVVGVMPKSFDFDSVFTPGTEVQMLTPFPLVEETTNWGNTLAVVGRLKKGVPLAQAQSELDVISARIREEFPNTSRFFHEVHTEMLDERIRGPFRAAFWVLSAAVGCVLAIACVNLANLLIARANGRRKEFALRSAIGARRGHLVRQTLIESLMLAGGGCIFGVVLASLCTRWLTQLEAFNVPLLQTTQLDGVSLAFVAVIAGLSGIACGILPALQLSAGKPSEAMMEGGQRGSSSGRRAGWLRRGLVVTEVALACLLLIGAGLLIRSFEALVNVDTGFNAESAVAWRVDGGRNFQSSEERDAYFESMARHIEALPGVKAAGLTDTLPLGRNRAWGIAAQGEEGKQGPGTAAFPRMVDHRYIDAMEIPLVAGRFFNEFDTGATQRMVVINKALARRLWGDQDPVGQIALQNGEVKVIGVVEDVRHTALDTDPSPEMYFLMRQLPDYSSVELVVRARMSTDLLVSEVRRELKAFDGTVPTEEYKSLQAIVDKSVAPQRMIMVVLSAFSAVALALAAIGLYGVISYSVGQRSNEIGIRMAVGARAGTVMRMVVSEGFVVAIVGVSIGLLAAFAFSRYLNSLLFSTAATDPTIFTINAGLVVTVSVLATIVPARRVMRVDPAKALRAG